MGWFSSSNENINIDNNSSSTVGKNAIDGVLWEIIIIIIIAVGVYISFTCIKNRCKKYLQKKVQQQTKLAVLAENV
jgi:hypothetical protein